MTTAMPRGRCFGFMASQCVLRTWLFGKKHACHSQRKWKKCQSVADRSRVGISGSPAFRAAAWSNCFFRKWACSLGRRYGAPRFDLTVVQLGPLPDLLQELLQSSTRSSTDLYKENVWEESRVLSERIWSLLAPERPWRPCAAIGPAEGHCRAEGGRIFTGTHGRIFTEQLGASIQRQNPDRGGVRLPLTRPARMLRTENARPERTASIADQRPQILRARRAAATARQSHTFFEIIQRRVARFHHRDESAIRSRADRDWTAAAERQELIPVPVLTPSH